MAGKWLVAAIHAVANDGVVADQQHVLVFGTVDYILQLLTEFFLGEGFAVGIGRFGPVEGMCEPGRIDGHQAHQRGHIHHFGAGAAVGGYEGILAGQLLFDVFFEAAHGF